MDLHDYRDVAENYDRYLDVMYKDSDSHKGFREFYLSLAEEYGQDGCIDIACGTGAVLLYLAERGIDIDGTDLSEPMCDVARKKAQEKGLCINIFPADMTSFSASRKYSLAIIARSGFMHLTTPELQRAALLNIRNNLKDGGILTLNTFWPHPVFQAQQMNTDPEKDYSLRLEYINSDGRRERIYNAITYDPQTQIMSGNWKFETLDDGGNVTETRVRPLALRQTYKQEMKYLAELCGYDIVRICSGYDRNGSGDSSKELIWILRKNARTL